MKIILAIIIVAIIYRNLTHTPKPTQEEDDWK
jgi:hypothetical protein